MSAHRDRVDRLGEAILDGLEKTLGRGCQIGLQGTWDDHEVLNRPSPLRAALVELSSPLADCMVAVTTMHEDTIRSAMAAATMSLTQALGVEVDVSMPEIHEYENRDRALDQLDALFGESTLHFTTPKGDLLIVFGTALLDAVQVIETGGAPAADMDGLEEWEEDFDLGAGMGADDMPTVVPAAANADVPAVPTVVGAPAIVPGANPMFAATAEANQQAAGAPEWEDLLTGVEVDVSAELGSTKLSLGAMTSFERDSIVTLDQSIDDPVDVFVNGTLYARAQLVVVNDEYGIEIIEVFDEARVPTHHLAA
jgi:flagellar motor switch protein FliN/FliY